ncbi:MAG TPA: sugar-transfer associated ATP-grasp domain-containing protein [Clostridia bacterium]|nr:sugar-transfer associated ATP-grasp domain-containing protein [Clostridia bacterium]
MQLTNALPFVKSAWLAAKKQALLTDRSFLDLYIDILRCKFKYGTALSDYLLFNFMEIRDPKMREEYIFAKDWMQLVHNLNPPNDTPDFLSDKVVAYKRFKKYFHRDVLIIADSSDDDIRAFCEKHATFYAKRALSYAGRDVEKIMVDPHEMDQTVSYVRERYDMLEEEIVQHPLLDTVSPSAVASFRFTILKYQGRILVLPLSLRIALWDDVDIIKMGQSSACVAIDEEGRFISPAVVNDSVFDPAFETRYDHHPTTGVAISDASFQVPFFKEMVEMMLEITRGEDEYGHIGWDIAVSDKGPCVIEGNPWGHYDFYQYYDHVKRTMRGIRPTIESFMGSKIRDLPIK